MRKRNVLPLLVLLLIFILSGCSNQSEPQNLKWQEDLRRLIRANNYTVVISTFEESSESPCSEMTGYYDGTHSKITTANRDEETRTIYYSKSDNNCSIYGWTEEPGIWIKAAVPEDDRYFYAYAVIERLRKLGGYVDLGQIRFDSENNTYTGSDLKGNYVVDDKEHHVKSVEIQFTDDQRLFLREEYTVGNDQKTFTDEVRIDHVDMTKVDLPLNTISEDEIAAK